MDKVASNYGLAFSISPAKKRPKKGSEKDEDDEEYCLTLAPFCKAPKINFGEVKINTAVERTVLIMNPQQFDVKLNVTNQDLEINNMELFIAKNENISFKIKWQPEKANSYKYSIMFEVTNSARLKFLVHAFGVCVAPPQKKIRKPVTTFQPLKKEKSIQNQTVIETTSKTAPRFLPTKPGAAAVPPKIQKEPIITFQPLKKDLAVEATAINQHYNNLNNTDNNHTIIHKNFSPSVFSTVKKQIPEQIESTASLTPKLADFLKPSSYHSKLDSHTPKQPLNTQLNYDYEEQTSQNSMESSFPLVNTTIIISSNQLPIKVIIQLQRQWRMKRFRNCLRQLKYQVAQDAIKAALANTQKINDEAREQETQIVLRGFIKLQLHFRMKQFRKYVIKLKEIRNEQLKKEQLMNAIIMVQKNWRMKKFRQNLKQLKIKRELDELNRISLIIICQRSIRMKLFRINLKKLRDHQALLIKHVINCQRVFRMKKFRLHLKTIKQNNKQMNQNAVVIKNQWRKYKFRKEMKKYRNAVICIQSWVRSMKERFIYLKLKRGTVLIQRLIRLRLKERNKAALFIQNWYRTKKDQQKYKLINTSVLVIQKWIRSKADRIKYLNWKRINVPIQKQTNAAILIQRQWRLFKFRSQMKIYRKSAVTLQRWHRSLKLRYEFLRKRDAICRIQALYRRVYMVRRHSAALKIQCAWRMFKAINMVAEKRIEYQLKSEARREQDRLNRYATMIQAFWKGYLVRKQTDQILNKIRNRLSFFGQNSSLSNYQAKTLGARIRNSLKILSFANVPIQQIILALVDLDKVTRLSPECCQIFVREGALAILYTFILNCNRSVPHMDLIKLCLKILINLAKYNETVIRIVEPSESLFILSNLLYAYHSSNAVIFIDTCILFILLAQCKQLNEWFLSQETLIKKLLNIHSTLERKTILKLKQTNQIPNPLSSTNAAFIQQQALNVSITSNTTSQATLTAANSLLPNKKSVSVSFCLQPEWSLRKKTIIELIDPIGAIEYFLFCLKIKLDSSLPKTPKKLPTLNLIRELGSTSSAGKSSQKEDHFDSAKLSRLATNSRIPLSLKSNKTENTTTSSRQLNFKHSNNIDENTENEPNTCDFTIDDHYLSICSNESYSNTTMKSIASSFFNEEPRLNSTSISTASYTSYTKQQLKPKQTQTLKKETDQSSSAKTTVQSSSSRRKLV